MDQEIKQKGLFFDEETLQWIRDQFYLVDEDIQGKKRLFFENAGGALRLKACVQAKAKFEEIPDCPERKHATALMLQEVMDKGRNDVLQVIFGSKGGSLITELSASQAMFQMVGAVVENIPGSNVVTSILEHPSAYDAAAYYCQKTGKELRVAKANQKTGQIDPQEIVSLIDENTCLLSIMYASNVTGSIMDMYRIVSAARAVKPDLYIITDAVQHIPHASVDVARLNVDGINFAPYKAFGIRGCGFAYVSDRLAKLPHRKLLGKGEDVWYLGTPTPANFAAVSAQVDYVCSLGAQYISSTDRRDLFVEGMERIHLHERALLERMLNGSDQAEGLRKQEGVNVHMDFEDLSTRDLILCISLDGIDFDKTVEEYGKKGIIVYERVVSSIYSKRMMDAFNLKGAIRVSPLHCHTKADVDWFLQATKEIVSSVR
ncbi:MAG: aminotransferase class V-fold PLP-dependent enzyme [Spirochaetia bacterium]|nr:aminotransferase class V-fold PLP-dependent enzyme [Spirochaetia bacterium]